MVKTTIDLDDDLNEILKEIQQEKKLFSFKETLNSVLKDYFFPLLDFESFLKALDLASSHVKCPKSAKTLPIYRLPCFHEFLTDDSILEDVDKENARIRCDTNCELTNPQGGLRPLCFIAAMVVLDGKVPVPSKEPASKRHKGSSL